jgi:NADH-quinone oxidoreductase B subunit
MFKSDKKSIWIVHMNCNSCNGCDIEFLACLTPTYDAERFGVVHVGSPKHADVMVVTGSVNHRNARVLENIYNQMPEPRAVVAMGACGACGGIFAECYNVLGGADKVVPVDVFVPGCPPRPEAMLEGIVRAAGILERRRHGEIVEPASKPEIVCRPAPVEPTPPTEQDQPKEKVS